MSEKQEAQLRLSTMLAIATDLGKHSLAAELKAVGELVSKGWPDPEPGGDDYNPADDSYPYNEQ